MKGSKRGFLKDVSVVLVLLLIVLIVPLLFPPGEITGKFISGNVVNPISLSKTEYAPGEKLEGNLKIAFNQGDLIPKDSVMYFFFQSPKCPAYFFCSENKYVPWCSYSYTGECVCVNEQALKNRCGIIISDQIACENPYLPVDAFCCEERSTIGKGIYYQNLKCSIGECWSDCQDLKKEVLTSLIALSSTPNSGNYTSGVYSNVNGNSPPGSGPGFSFCGSGSSISTARGDYTISPLSDIIGYATVEEATATDLTLVKCYDSDGGDNPYIGGKCTDYLGTRSDSCLAGVAEDVATEYYCSSLSNTCVSKKYYCPSGCVSYTTSGGACKTTIGNVPTCFDSDLGKIYGTKGTCTDSLGKTYTDFCTTGVAEDMLLTEYFCKETSCASEQTACLYGCYNGACKPKPTLFCNDPDKENVYVKSTCSDNSGKYTDYCNPDAKEQNEIIEYTCVDLKCTPKKLGCGLGCYDGTCKTQPTTKCLDTDNGFNYYALGTCTDYLGSYSDSCLLSPTGGTSTISTMAVESTSSTVTTPSLVEYGCVNNLCTVKQYTCPYGCLSGVCKYANCQDSDGGDNPFVRGTCNDKNGAHTDYCLNALTGEQPAITGMASVSETPSISGVLIEYSCTSKADGCTSKRYDCENGCEKGYCIEKISEPPITKKFPDLVVSKIYQRVSSNNPSSKNLFAAITNKGNGNAGTFLIAVYFADKYAPTAETSSSISTRVVAAVPSVLTYTVFSLPFGTSIEVDLGGISVEGKTVAVYADYSDFIREINEDNNILTQYFATVPCSCSDGGINLPVYGTCIDSIGIERKEECLSDGNTLVEWYCDDNVIAANVPSNCVSKQYNCKNNGFAGCKNGACTSIIYPDCQDSDGGNYPFMLGTCTDYTLKTYKDECISSKSLNEYYCSITSADQRATCVLANHDCQYGCQNGACLSGVQNQYSCDNWNNIYDIALSDISSLNVPSKEGIYNLAALLIYSDADGVTLLSQSTSETFVVEEQTGGGGGGSGVNTYNACINETCMVVQGSDEDECDVNSDCEYAPQYPIPCVNYIEDTECIYAGCYWYENSCHSIQESQLGGVSYYTSPTPTGSVKETLKGVPWWVWVIIGFMLVLIVVLVILKKGLPFTGKPKKEEKKELMKKYPALVAYINKAKEGGMLKEQLREKLMSKGWPTGTVDKAIGCFWETKKGKGKKELKELPPAPKMNKF